MWQNVVAERANGDWWVKFVPTGEDNVGDVAVGSDESANEIYHPCWKRQLRGGRPSAALSASVQWGRRSATAGRAVRDDRICVSSDASDAGYTDQVLQSLWYSGGSMVYRMVAVSLHA